MTAGDEDARPDDRIGEYLVRRLIGEGGMGKVYEAEERLSKRRVALKVLRPELARSENGRELFLNEMTILAHLDHPNIVRCLACTEADGQLVMALELLEGETLRSLLASRGRLSWGEATGIACQIIEALSVAHRQEPPIIHRDLKPENIMILPDGGVKVMDFGIAKVLQAISRTTTHSVGTLQYMSPEQIDAHGVDARSDLYGLGLVFYEMLSGAAPFESESPRELLNMQCTAPTPPLPDEVREGLPSGVERVLSELLEKSPDDRPESATQVAQQLEPFRPAGGSRPIERRPTGDGSSKDPAKSVRADTPGTRPMHTPAARVASSKGPDSSKDPASSNTIGLVERAMEPKRVSTKMAVLVVLGLSLAAGLGTYLVRRAVGPSEDDAPAQVTPEVAAPAEEPAEEPADRGAP